MINLPNGATPQQFVAGFILASAVGAVILTAAVWAAKAACRKIRKHRAYRAHVRRLAEIYVVEL